jgi:hypothetical protein
MRTLHKPKHSGKNSHVVALIATEQLTPAHCHLPLFCGRVSLYIRAAKERDALPGEIQLKAT